MPWHRVPGLFDVRNAATGNLYRGANVIALASTTLDRGYPTSLYATYKQWSSLGARVTPNNKNTITLNQTARCRPLHPHRPTRSRHGRPLAVVAPIAPHPRDVPQKSGPWLLGCGLRRRTVLLIAGQLSLTSEIVGACYVA